VGDDLAFAPLVDLVASLADGTVSSRELLELYLRRIEEHRELNAVVTLDERAFGRADEADRARAAGQPLGALHGVPMTVKDSFETAGVRTTSGAVELAAHVPARDADAVARLRAAGAIVFGKTNLPAWAGELQTDNELFGRTLNPWDLDRSPGGSSGGAAAAVAAGLAAGELGSDIGGSIRQPAANCGVFGLKPSYGIVPMRGHIPGAPGTLAEADVAVGGPIARAADDLELLLDVVAGPDERSAGAWRLELPPPQVGRIACWFDDDDYPLDHEVRALLESAADDLGAEQVRPPVRLRDALVLYQRLLAPLLSLGEDDESVERWRHEAALRAAPPDPSTQAAWEHWAGGLHRGWLGANEERWRLRAAWAEALEGFDAVLLPVTPVPSAPHQPLHATIEDWAIVVDGRERAWRELSPWLWLVGLLHLPAVAAPVGLTAAGLPVGVQVVGRFGGDRTAIEVARRVGRFVPPPRYVPEVRTGARLTP
jgi:amidase